MNAFKDRDNNRSSGACRINSEKNILQLALDLHGFVTGSRDGLVFSNKHKEVYSDLVEVEEHWKDDSNCEFDNVVRHLIRVALSEYEAKYI